MTHHTAPHSTLRKGLPAALVLAMLLLLSACRLPGLGKADLPDDGPPIATSPDAARQFLSKMTDASRTGVQTGRFTLTVTQGEVTSFVQVGADLAEQLQQAGNLENLEDLAQLQDLEGLESIEGLDQWQALVRQRKGLPKIRLPDLSLRLGIREPEVRFLANGQIVVRGYGQVRTLRQPLRVVIAPQVSDGELVLDFVEGNLGPVPLPESLIDLVGKGLLQVILLGQDVAEVTQIDVTENMLTLSGRSSTAQPGG